MIRVEPGEGLFRAFPALAELGPSGGAALLAAINEVSLPAGVVVFKPGQACENYLLIRAGSVRVHLLDEDGRQIVLYRLGAGDTCILTTAALLGSAPYAAFAVTESDVEASVVPAQTFEKLVAYQAAFRRFVFASHANRIADLMRLVSDVAFTRIQVRLARCLLQRADAVGEVRLTHDAISVEIGTAREVVSRNLKAFERQGLVRLGLGTLSIADGNRLSRIARPC